VSTHAQTGLHADYVQRFLFENLDIRGRVVSLTGEWMKMVAGRDYPARIVSLLGRTAALVVLMGANQKGARRITLQLQGEGPVTLLVADCTSAMRLRGMARAKGELDPAATDRALLGKGRMALTLEDDATGQTYQSLVPLEGEGLDEIFGHYLAQSEQGEAFILLHADEQSASAILLEKLPGADAKDADGWNRVTRLAATLAPGEAATVSAADLLVRLFHEELLRVYPLHEVVYHCPRDEEKVADMLRSLGRAEVDSILAEQGEVKIVNEMCNHEYRFDAAAVARMFEKIN
jgi:molecular chaperone Hsp33